MRKRPTPLARVARSTLPPTPDGGRAEVNAIQDPRATAPARTPAYTRNGTINSATMFATLIIGLMAGPAVSL
jgi:hypothetical protein